MDVLDTTEPSPVRQQGDMERVCAFSKRRRAARRRRRRRRVHSQAPQALRSFSHSSKLRLGRQAEGRKGSSPRLR